MRENRKTLTIGGLAKAAGVHVETIRYYQRRGLLRVPERPVGGIRRYGRRDLERLGFVRAAQRLGFSLDEVAELLHLDDGLHCDEASALAERKLAEVRERIADLRRIERVLAERVRACRAREDNPDCPLIASLHGEGIGQRRE
ncbi:Hg(II)-responsive transcriptional regulator [Halomonas nitroreducens]|uniref:Mercuric resistance operon regulatory protein n=1 Tax=Halomonas nitroreducens TaxID=447425 RepID=A0A431V8D7_9GAMM|nr:Hg(II)-responsive transcriptional regulator [Halomonas nitroreducens]RTR06468.1 Hg(II)-responsive transcriptional regulator [Halomonas nitroreducens]